MVAYQPVQLVIPFESVGRNHFDNRSCRPGQINLKEIIPHTTTSVLNAVLDIFDAIGAWIPEAVEGLIPMFYDTSTGLTFLGVLAVCGLAFSVIFLVMGIIQNFLHFRG